MRKYKYIVLVLLLSIAVYVQAVCERPESVERASIPFLVSDAFMDSKPPDADLMGYKLCLSGGHYVYQANGCQEDELEVGFEILQKPESMVYDPCSRQLDWRPVTSDIGEHWLILRTTPVIPPDGYEIESDTVAIILHVRYGRSWFCSLDEILTE